MAKNLLKNRKIYGLHNIIDFTPLSKENIHETTRGIEYFYDTLKLSGKQCEKQNIYSHPRGYKGGENPKNIKNGPNICNLSMWTYLYYMIATKHI